ncbi:MAG: RMD1 family protein [Methylovirgula sp.]
MPEIRDLNDGKELSGVAIDKVGPLPVATDASQSITRVLAHAIHVGDRIDAARFERGDMIATVPLATRISQTKFVALYRFGVVVFAGLSPAEETGFLDKIAGRISGRPDGKNEETAALEIRADYDDRVQPGGPVEIPDLSPARFLVVADVLAKSVSLARDENKLGGVFDAIEPFAGELARTGHTRWNRRSMLKLIGQALIAQHRISGRVAVEEKPDILWDHSSLERLYARLEDEYELIERAKAVTQKLNVIVETGQTLTDILDVDRSARLEAIIVLLILVETLVALLQIFLTHGHI